jgi:NitT/TauT family transport system substrate-binding protein
MDADAKEGVLSKLLPNNKQGPKGPCFLPATRKENWMMDEMKKIAGMKISRRAATAGLLTMAMPVQVSAAGHGAAIQSSIPPLIHSGAEMAVELAPVHVAMRRMWGNNAKFINGGVLHLVGPDRKADVASNGEAQNLFHSFSDPSIRILMTIAEGHYPILARHSAGVHNLADLKGKKILSYAHTTAGYFLHKMLQRVGLTFDDITIVETPLGDIPKVVANQEVDAVAIWEPDSQQAVWSLRQNGEDLTIFNGAQTYHERYNLCSTAENLADPEKRKAIVAYMRAIIDATRDINTLPAVAAESQEMVSRSGGLYTVEEVAQCFPNVKYVANIDEGLLDVFEDEDVWLAGLDKRRPRSRAELAKLIDTKPYEEAMAL